MHLVEKALSCSGVSSGKKEADKPKVKLFSQMNQALAK